MGRQTPDDVAIAVAAAVALVSTRDGLWPAVFVGKPTTTPVGRQEMP